MKSILASLALLSALFAGTATASESKDFNFGSVSINHLDWVDATESRSHLSDFNFIEVEAGGGRNWGTFYGFVDIENVDKYNSLSELQASVKANAAFNTPLKDVAVYTQVFSVLANDFYTADTVVGAQYQGFHGANWSFNPFIGVQHSYTSAGFSGMNGMMAGWSAMYNFKAYEQNFSFTNWHEFTTNRNSDYLALGEKEGFSVNGGAAFWWHMTKDITTGLQYRYADNKLGTDINANAVIYTLKFNF
jgi:hypothetical protein